MKHAKFIVLCAPTPRSQAYLQAIHYAGLNPDHIILYGMTSQPTGQLNLNSCLKNQDIFIADFSLSIEETIQQMECSASFIEERDIGCDELYNCFQEWKPELTIFSGFGGQIVPERILMAAGKMLHIHSGWLPEYRGSTTLYYSLLKEGRCAASALLLTNEIDGGPVLARQYYPSPHPSDNIDYVYDCSIRADLLVQVLCQYNQTGKLPDPVDIKGEGDMYYVIHPLLKHLAVLSLE